MLRTLIVTGLFAVGLLTFAGAAEASPVDKANDKTRYTVDWECDATGHTCVLKAPVIPDPFDPCTCPPID